MMVMWYGLNIMWYAIYCDIVAGSAFNDVTKDKVEDYYVYRDLCLDGVYWELNYATKTMK